MRLQTYRGYRIRASDKSLVFRFSAGLLLLLFLAVVMLLNLKSIITTDWKAISLFEDGSVYLPITPYRIVTIIVATLVCVLSALFYRRFQYDRGVSFTFALFNCILFALKHGKTMKTDGMIVSIKSTNPTNEKWRNAKLAEVSYLVNGKRIVSKNRIQVSLTSEIGTHIPIRYDRNQPDKIYSYSVKRIIIGFLIGVGSILIAVFMQIH